MNMETMQWLSQVETPAYVLDIGALRQRVEAVRAALAVRPGTRLCYAMKANPFLVKPLMGLVDAFEVCSPGELAICMQAGVPAESIILSGVNKEYADVAAAMAYGVDVFTAESWKHLSLIEQCAAEQGRSVSVLPRLTSGNQFGVDKETIVEMTDQRGSFPHVSFCGIHFYSGTQKRAFRIEEEAKDLRVFFDELNEVCPNLFTMLEYGPGLQTDYFGKGGNYSDILEQCVAALNGIDQRYRLTVELGRFLAADCGNYVTKVMDVKHSMQQQYCIVDGGINHVSYYGQVMGVRIPPVRLFRRENNCFVELPMGENSGGANGICVCGSLCTSADVLIKSVAFDDVKEGDLFVFEKVGAYSVTEGIYLFLSRKLPKVYLLEHGEMNLVRDSLETYGWNCGVY